MVCLRIPEWTLACIAGLALGFFFRPNWAFAVVPAAVGYTFVVDLYLRLTDNPYSQLLAAFDSGIRLRLLMWQLFTVALFILCGYLASRRGGRDDVAEVARTPSALLLRSGIRKNFGRS